MMRILFVISGLGYGGSESQLIALATEIRRLDHEVHVFVLTDHAPRARDLEMVGVPVRVDHKSARLDLGLLLRLRRHIMQVKPDIIHGFLFDGNWYATMAAVGLRWPVMCSERNSDYRLTRAQRLAVLLSRRFVRGLIANSERGSLQAAEMFGLPASRTHVVWNGLDLGRIDQRILRANCRCTTKPTSDRDRVVVVVASFSEAKDQLLAIEVASRLRAMDQSWKMWLVGSSLGNRLTYASEISSRSVRYLQRVQDRIQELGLVEFVELKGQREDVIEIMASADVLLSTSRHEGSPNVVLESMAVGTPVVATEFSDIRRLLPFDWQVVDDRSPDRLARAVCRAATDRAEVAGRQRAWVEANATIEGAARKSLAIYAAQLGLAGCSGRTAGSSS